MNTEVLHAILPLARTAFAQGAALACLTISLYFLISLGSFKSKATDGRAKPKWKPYLASGHHITDVKS